MTAARTLARARSLLSPEERFRVGVLALARDDDDEVRRLVDSCPTRVYRQPDARFMDRWEDWRVLAATSFWLADSIRVRARLATLACECAERVAAWTEEAIEFAAWKVAREHGVDFTDADFDFLRRDARVRANRLVAALAAGQASALAAVAAWEAALDAFAGELELAPDIVRSALGQPPRPAEGLAEPDPQSYQDLLGLLRRLLSRA